MYYFTKTLTFLFLILTIISCASNLKFSINKEKSDFFIEKPGIKLNFNRLPNEINIFLLSFENPILTSELLNGLMNNYFYYKKEANYTPTLNIQDLSRKKIEQCNFVEYRKNYSLVFILDKSLENIPSDCKENLLSLRGLLILFDSDININNPNLTQLDVKRLNDSKDLLKYAREQEDKNSIIIDDLETKDKNLLKKIWKGLDGTTAKTTTAHEGIEDEDLLSKILLIEQSKVRGRKLSRAMSTPIEYIPRSRQDIDLLILSVSIAKARRLKPALEYNFAESIKVYLVPDWKSNANYTNLEKDLEGSIVIDMPFKLNSLVTFPKIEEENRNRLFATGYDAYELSILLSSSIKKRNFSFIGMTGKLSLEPNGDISRKSLKVEVIDGKFKSLGY